MTIDQGDVLIFQTIDGGEINIEGGVTQLTGGFETAFYLSLFGGNEDDDGSEGNVKNWWGNLVEEDPILHYRSRTQNILRGLPMTSGNLIRIEDAANLDLKWMLDIGAVEQITVSASITSERKLKIEIEHVANGENITTVFLINWQAQSAEAA